MTSCEFIKNIREYAKENNRPLELVDGFEAANCAKCDGTACLGDTSEVEDNTLNELAGNGFIGLVSAKKLKQDDVQHQIEERGFNQVLKFFRKDKKRDKHVLGMINDA